MRAARCIASLLTWAGILVFFTNCEPVPRLILEPEVMKTPASSYSMQPALYSEKDSLYMVWTEKVGDGNHSLVFSSFSGNAWTEKKEIERGSDWFVNWADFPTVSKNGNALVSHFLKKSDTATFSYDIQYVHSPDLGDRWSQGRKLHADTIKAEHGFVSFSPLDEGRFLAVWLDGRNTSVPAEQEGAGMHMGHGGMGAMQLRSGLIDSLGRNSSEQLVDARTCDCCQTSLVTTPAGSLVAYRDRTEGEIRDIYVSLLREGRWSEPKPVFKDNWKINGCPVNGPKLSAFDSAVCLVWFTAANDKPEVKIAFSEDGGVNFEAPIRVDEGLPVGRVDVVMLDAQKALVSWMESKGTEAEIRLALIDRERGKVSAYGVSEVSGARATGFPQLEIAAGKVYLAWNDIKDGHQQLKLIRTDLEEIYP